MGRFNCVSMNKAKELAEKEGYIVVDMRSEKEFYQSHVENAINIPMCDADKIASFGKKNLVWVLYCRRGSLSFKLASELADLGYKVLAVAGGYGNKG
jgi:rhodanese-related sulfurtransferase